VTVRSLDHYFIAVCSVQFEQSRLSFAEFEDTSCGTKMLGGCDVGRTRLANHGFPFTELGKRSKVITQDNFKAIKVFFLSFCVWQKLQNMQ